MCDFMIRNLITNSHQKRRNKEIDRIVTAPWTSKYVRISEAISALDCFSPVLKKNFREYFKELSDFPYHWRIGSYDYWPTTSRFMNRETRYKGRGFENLLNKLKE